MNFPSSEPQDLLTEHLLNHPHALGFVGVGIGKTAATLAALAKLIRSGESRGALVLAPMRVANLTWPLEVQRWDDFNWMRVANLRQESGKRAFLQGTAHIYVCNFESIPMLLKLVKGRKSVSKELPYDTLIVDECFAPGTLVDTVEGKKPIEKVKKGDCVINAVGVGVVTHVHKNRIHEAVCLVINGEAIWCSSGHKFFTTDGWVSAKEITRSSKIIASRQSLRTLRSDIPTKGTQQRKQNEILLQEMLHKTHRGEACVCSPDANMCSVFDAVQKAKEQTLLREQLCYEMEESNRRGVLDTRKTVKCFKSPKSLFRFWKQIFSRSEKKIRCAEPNDQSSQFGEIENDTQKDKAQTPCARRQWETYSSSANGTFQNPGSLRAGVVDQRVCDQNLRHEMQRKHAQSLQAGYCLPFTQTMDRGGWPYPQFSDSQNEGCQEDRGLSVYSVESIEVCQPEDPRLDGFRASDGHVYFYDLSVSRHPSYSVNGMLVHNCTKIKNPSAKRPNAYRRDVPHPLHKRIWALTGTPAPNTLLDLFAQVRFVDEGHRLGKAFDLFKQTYFKPSGFQGYQWKELPGSKEKIEERIHDITLTLRSKDWLDIPDTVVEDVDIHLCPKLAHDYKEFEKELVLQIKKDKEITAANAAALVSKLLQFTSGSMYDEEKKVHDIHSLKLDALAKIIKEADGPVLVAYAFQHEAARIRERFPQARFFSDAKNATSQTQLLNDWNDGKIPMMIAHPKSIGHGLNMQGSEAAKKKGIKHNIIVWFTLTYSREDYEQMIARLVRRGQDAIVKVWRLMCQDTVDYAVATVIEEKKMTEDRLLTALQLLESFRTTNGKPVKINHYQEGEWI